VEAHGVDERVKLFDGSLELVPRYGYVLLKNKIKVGFKLVVKIQPEIWLCSPEKKNQL
jgi:hypothetical protein